MHELLRSVWREPRPAPPPPRVRWDWALVAVLATVAVLEGVLRPGLEWRVLSVVICAGLVFTLPWRRSRPLLVVTIAFGVCGVSPLLVGGPFPNQNVLVYLVLLPFSLFRWGSGREAATGAAIIFAKLGLDAALGFLPLGDAFAGVFIVTAAMALGAALRYRSRARGRELDQVKLLERARLARDLHDTVAHHVSAMAIRAQAGIATAATNPAAAVDALRVIDAEAARALDEMRGMVRLLRTQEPADLSPGPRVTDLTRLKPPVDVTLTGDVDSLPSPVSAAIYRLAQEAVTNAQRHARHATRIEVRVEADDHAVRLSVRDDGDPPGRPDGSTGFGLVGMAERAELLGGTCEAGPAPDRGWAVTAVLPRVAP
ncbi:sensor histidine kinase [Actinophytocola algeriensis]|uniref:histidine kinase n=1 Tax=Actinophytocola algeriensis TaxID=1768010 RepID=A0A7W7Q696_9PSEU|nr:histidine kinase [Actinophytocola algeriensis]MBB4907734.1 signal transduction histidine kinase [Actinophytocola algeriensis]MBE1479764.1 signal transduction histidine kinase [Actinophytocola algeriensis]